MDTTTTILCVHMTDVQKYNAMVLSQEFSNHDGYNRFFYLYVFYFCRISTHVSLLRWNQMIHKYLNNAIVCLFFSHLDCVFTTKNKHIWIFFFSGVCTNSVSFWSFLLGQTQVDLEGGNGGGLCQNKSCSHFPMCDRGCQTLPSKQSSYSVRLTVETITKSDQGVLMVRSFVICCPLTRILIFTFSFKNFHVNISFRASKASNSIWQHLFKIVEPNSTFAISSSFAWFWLNFLSKSYEDVKF
jgi:hypothetical protein